MNEGLVINEAEIESELSARAPDAAAAREVLAKARLLQGLGPEDVCVLAALEDPELLEELYDTARGLKETIYGRRLVLFAPLYVSNLCANECLYCAFRASNKGVRRKALSQECERIIGAGLKSLHGLAA